MMKGEAKFKLQISSCNSTLKTVEIHLCIDVRCIPAAANQLL